MFHSEPQSDKERKQFQRWNSIMENTLLPASSRSDLGCHRQTKPSLLAQAEESGWLQRCACFTTIWSIHSGWSCLFACDEGGRGQVKSPSQNLVPTLHTVVQLFHPFPTSKEMGIPDHLTCLFRNLYACQEATVRTGHGTTDWFQIGRGVHQGCILSLCLFNLCAEYIMRNTGLEEAQAGIKIVGYYWRSVEK